MWSIGIRGPKSEDSEEEAEVPDDVIIFRPRHSLMNEPQTDGDQLTDLSNRSLGLKFREPPVITSADGGYDVTRAIRDAEIAPERNRNRNKWQFNDLFRIATTTTHDTEL